MGWILRRQEGEWDDSDRSSEDKMHDELKTHPFVYWRLNKVLSLISSCLFGLYDSWTENLWAADRRFLSSFFVKCRSTLFRLLFLKRTTDGLMETNESPTKMMSCGSSTAVSRVQRQPRFRTDEARNYTQANWTPAARLLLLLLQHPQRTGRRTKHLYAAQTPNKLSQKRRMSANPCGSP